MIVERKLPVRHFVISEVKALDPVRVYIENYEPGKGRITISCYDAAWVGYWGAMSGDTIEEFFKRNSADYLAGNMGSASTLSRSKQSFQYLIRVIEAVKAALNEEAA
jgi:hypothetical protein